MEVSCVKDVCILAFLGINSWIDIRKKQISLFIVIIFTVCGITWTVCSKGSVPEFLLCAGTGLGFVGFSILTEGAVGMGDGWLILALGTVMRPPGFFSMIFIASICSAVWAGIMFMIFRSSGHTEIPFVPFLLVGYVGVMLL